MNRVGAVSPPPFSKIQLFKGLQENSCIYQLSPHLEGIGSIAFSKSECHSANKILSTRNTGSDSY